MEEEEEDYILYGTPLPEIEEESILRKKAAKELEVRDERGRQRFHGAFTGGFSAGYFNTVGTKEGWAPSTFVSSRAKKEKDYKGQNPEDFMDEEDFGEFGIATRRIHTTSKFQDSSGSSGTNKRKFSEIDSVIPGEAPLKDIVKPVKESIGIKILKKLGWKLGQGIGPRVKKPVTSVKIYGCALPETIESEEDDPFAQSYTFAPEDTKSEVYESKDNVFGLGYSGLSKESVLSVHNDTLITTKSWLKKDKKKLVISGQAFGVGAFEDEDEDIYNKDDMSQYDFTDLDPKGSSQISKETESKKHYGSSSFVLDGFCLASSPATVKKYYPPPELPQHYRPFHSSKIRVVTHSEPHFKSRHSLSAEDRSTLLGERKFQSLPSTVEKKEKEVKPLVEKLDKSMPSSKHSFRPFPNDEVKQKRYEEYLKLKDSGDIEKLVQPSSMTEWEKQQELEEFSRAAILFKPLSAALSAKFESRSHLDIEHEVMDALAKAKKESIKKVEEKRKLVGLHNRKTFEWHPASLLCKRFNVPNPYPNSSEVSGSQKPKSLFDHISFESREAEKHEQISCASPKNIPDKVPSSERPDCVVSQKPDQENILENTFMTSINKAECTPDQLTETGRPPIDFFKDIFENSSSDEDDLSQTETKASESPPKIENFEKESNVATTSHETGVLVSNQKFNTDISASNPKIFSKSEKVGFGVFANLDLDALNQRGPRAKQSSSESVEIKNDVIDLSRSPVNENGKINDESNIQIENQSIQNDLYGPELPPGYNESSVSNSSKSVAKKHTKHKAKHKHKHHKYKSKKKKKKHSSHKSSDDSSFDSDEDIPSEVLLEKIKKLQKVLK